MASRRYRQAPRPEIRASDAERERVAAFLRDKAAEGCLTADELDERVGRAYAAVRIGELDRLVVDLPQPPGRPTLQRARDRGLVPLGIAAAFAVAVPGLLWVLFWTAFALGIALVVLAAALGLVLSPLLIAIALGVTALRRRRTRYWRPLHLR